MFEIGWQNRHKRVDFDDFKSKLCHFLKPKQIAKDVRYRRGIEHADEERIDEKRDEQQET